MKHPPSLQDVMWAQKHPGWSLYQTCQSCWHFMVISQLSQQEEEEVTITRQQGCQTGNRSSRHFSVLWCQNWVFYKWKLQVCLWRPKPAHHHRTLDHQTIKPSNHRTTNLPEWFLCLNKIITTATWQDQPKVKTYLWFCRNAPGSHLFWFYVFKQIQ